MAAEILSIGPIQLNEEAGGLTVQTQGALDIIQVYAQFSSTPKVPKSSRNYTQYEQ